MKTLQLRPPLRISSGTIRFMLVLVALLALALSQSGALNAAGVGQDFKQCANGGPYTDGACNWINSILQHNNSTYSEGMSVPQRLIISHVPATGNDQHTVQFDVMTTKGGIHAYDWVVSWEQAAADATAAGIPFRNDTFLGNPCYGLTGATLTLCNTLKASTNIITPSVPDDPFFSYTDSVNNTQARIDLYETMRGNRTIKIYSDATISAVSFTVAHVDSNGTTISNGQDTGDSFLRYNVTFTSKGSNYLLLFAGHLAISGDTCNVCLTWGPAKGSGAIDGGPYHFKSNGIDGKGGSVDNQIQSGSIATAPTIRTARSVASAGADVYDSAFLWSGKGTPTGDVHFYLCWSTQPPFTPAASTALPNGCTKDIVDNGSTIRVFDLGLGTRQGSTNEWRSPAYQIPSEYSKGFYCFRAEYSPDAAGSVNWTYASETNNEVSGEYAECFVITGATAVTLTDFSARTEDGRGLMIMGLGLAGIAILGALGFVFARKR